MAKFRIKRDTVDHGAISWRHSGNDDQYCEAGEDVTIAWQPTAGWGLQEAHYTDGDGNVTAIDLTTRTFTMPSEDITIGGTFKKFTTQDWTGSGNAGDLLSIGGKGEAVPVPNLFPMPVVTNDTGRLRNNYMTTINTSLDLKIEPDFDNYPPVAGVVNDYAVLLEVTGSPTIRLLDDVLWDEQAVPTIEEGSVYEIHYIVVGDDTSRVFGYFREYRQ